MATLAERIGSPGPPPGPDATRLVRRVHDLFDVRLDALTAEDLRLLLRQRVAPNVLLPYAVALLVADPWAGGDMNDGALLAAVLAVPESTWPAGCADRLAARLLAPDAQGVLGGSSAHHDRCLSSQATGYPVADDEQERSTWSCDDGGPDLGDDVRAAAVAFLADRSSARA